MWRIEAGPEPTSPPGFDGTAWTWQIMDAHDGHRTVEVRVSGTAMSMDQESLWPWIGEAIRSEGRSAVYETLDWEEPPKVIELDSKTLNPRLNGGAPGSEHDELLEIAEWFEERGLDLIFIGDSALLSAAGAGREEIRSFALQDGDQVHEASGPSRLEAARAIKRVAHGTTSNRAPAIAVSQQLVGLARALEERFSLIWTRPTDAGDQVWVVQVYDDSGDLVAIGAGDNREDCLLGVAEDLLPEEKR